MTQQHSTQQNDNSSIVPPEFICPITLQIMRDPVMTKYGHNFERSAILEWLHRGHTRCPITRKKLNLSKLVPNAALRLKIRKWQDRTDEKIYICLESELLVRHLCVHGEKKQEAARSA